MAVEAIFLSQALFILMELMACWDVVIRFSIHSFIISSYSVSSLLILIYMLMVVNQKAIFYSYGADGILLRCSHKIILVFCLFIHYFFLFRVKSINPDIYVGGCESKRVFVVEHDMIMMMVMLMIIWYYNVI